MTFRARISLVILVAGLLPTLTVVFLSAYLLNSTLEKIGAAGFENSLESARLLVEQSQETSGNLLKNKLSREVTQMDEIGLRRWLKTNNLDLAYCSKDSFSVRVFSDSLGDLSNAKFPGLMPGMAHVQLDSSFFIAYSISDSGRFYGCGLLMPGGFGERGREFSQALTASASLGAYKTLLIKTVAITVFMAIASILIISLIASTVIGRRLVRPLQILSSGASAIGAGDLDYKVVINRGDEFSELAASFNSMATQIKENQNKLLEAQRLAAWREVARRIAHEIRNPLTPINIELYRLEQFLDSAVSEKRDEISKSLAIVKTQILVLQEMAQQFSTFAKEPEPKLIRCSLKNTISSAVDIFRANQDLCLTIRIDDNLPLLDIDPQMFSRAIINLIKNSIEASPQNPKIDIIAWPENGNVILTLRDHGPGFPPEKLERMEQPYITSKKTGSGLGLAIVKKIVEEHGGSVRFYNDSGAAAEIKLVTPKS